MHFEILVEDASGKILLEEVLRKIVPSEINSSRIKCYKGIGRLPKNLNAKTVQNKRILLEQLPRLLRGYGKVYPENAGIGAIVVVADCDKKDCRELLSEMNSILPTCNPAPLTLFRIAIEECEAWMLGDTNAVRKAYPDAKQQALDSYAQDSICGTWERLADAIHNGGSAALKKLPYSEIGRMKCEWAKNIGREMDVENNRSPSFCKFRDGLRRLAAM